MAMMLTIIGIVLVLSLVLGMDRSWSNILIAERNDMVFENRNRGYGAYYLRQSYSRLLLFALLGTMGFVGVAIGLPKIMSMFGEGDDNGNMLKKEVMVELQQAEEEKQEEEPPPPPPPPPPPQIEMLQFTPPVATNEEVEEEPPTQEEVQNTNVGETTQEGENVDAPPVVENVVVEDEIFDAAALSEQAEPPGGMKGFLEYMGKNIKYPAMEKESGIEGKVYISFVVGADGSLTDFTIKRSLSKGCDNEAVRVLKAYPNKWVPGKMGGKSVKSRFTLPVNFKLG